MEHILSLYNTLTEKKEKIEKKYKISLYTCGPTVYDYAHIGNFRSYVFEDVLKRVLFFLGQDVEQVMNITDVDDKTLKGAIARRCSLEEYTKPYIEAFFEDLKTLNILPADHYPKATDYISQMIKIIEKLLEKQVAYKGKDGSIYFSIRQFPNYGKLSHLHLEDLQQGASNRIQNDEYDKENASDFVLWKAYDSSRDGEIYWESPFGLGRPGWHIECSAMALDILGDTIDIHCGGVDNIFPHHENEIAQSEAFTGKQFVKVWAHAKHLIVEGKKMSKSLGNFYTLRNLLDKGYTGQEVRYLLMQGHYRQQLNFTMEGLLAARNSLLRIKDFINRLEQVEEERFFHSVEKPILEASEKFNAALCDDLNISSALASLFDLIHQVNKLIDEKRIGRMEAGMIIAFLKRVDTALGVLPLEKEKMEIPQEVLKALEDREQARRDRDFQLADEKRDFIVSQGYVIKDTAQGPQIQRRA
ncbi:MAG TPA: cysteine--tRNA ligase [Chlamydiales bacterium]|nr:cysteine--tRNA ligase [Chlamydiales bacterium]